MARKNYLSIHYLRIMACFMVILIHISATPMVTLTPNSVSQFFFILLNQFSKPAVPIFIMISGFLLHSIYRETELSPIKYWIKRLPKLIIPYVLWSLGYYLIYMKLGYYPFDLAFIIKGLIFGTFIYHLYFMVIIIQFYIVYPLLHFVSKKIGELPLFITILAIQFALIKVPFEYRDRFFVTYFCYFGIGLLFSKYLPILMKIPKIHYWGALGFLAAGALNTFLILNSQNSWVVLPTAISLFSYTFISTLCCVSLFAFFEGLANSTEHTPSKTARLGKLGNATQLIYFAHPLFILLNDYLMNRLGIISISLRAFSAFMIILIVLVPSAYYLKNHIQINGKLRKI